MVDMTPSDQDKSESDTFITPYTYEWYKEQGYEMAESIYCTYVINADGEYINQVHRGPSLSVPIPSGFGIKGSFMNPYLVAEPPEGQPADKRMSMWWENDKPHWHIVKPEFAEPLPANR
jgi:hypothetical protein